MVGDGKDEYRSQNPYQFATFHLELNQRSTWTWHHELPGLMLLVKSLEGIYDSSKQSNSFEWQEHVHQILWFVFIPHIVLQHITIICFLWGKMRRWRLNRLTLVLYRLCLKWLSNWCKQYPHELTVRNVYCVWAWQIPTSKTRTLCM